jgi:hypothetical protein
MIVNAGLKVFLLGFNHFGIARDAVTAFLDSRSEVHNWYTILPGQIFVVSRNSASEIADLLRKKFPDQFIFVGEIQPEKADGWLPKEAWTFITTPTSNRDLSLRPPPGQRGQTLGDLFTRGKAK